MSKLLKEFKNSKHIPKELIELVNNTYKKFNKDFNDTSKNRGFLQVFVEEIIKYRGFNKKKFSKSSLGTVITYKENMFGNTPEMYLILDDKGLSVADNYDEYPFHFKLKKYKTINIYNVFTDILILIVNNFEFEHIKVLYRNGDTSLNYYGLDGKIFKCHWTGNTIGRRYISKKQYEEECLYE